RPSGVTEYRHLIPAGTGSAIYTRRSDATNSTYYASSDHLGSGDLIMDSAANVLARESFNPFGARRGSAWTGLPTAADNTTFAQTTRRGYTGHEMLDAVSLVHMNGRVYDPQLGRFLSADPIVQTINVSQAINPFSYVMNNPLTLTDPSGYSWLSKIFHAIGNFLQKYWRPIVAIIVAVVTYGYASAYFASLSSTTIGTATVTSAVGATTTVSLTSVAIAGSTTSILSAAAAGAVAGAVAGGITGGRKGALAGAFSRALFGGINAAFADSWNFGRVAANGVAGGASSEVAGGNFRDGLIMSAVMALAQLSYNKMMKYDVTWDKGKGLASENGTYDEKLGVPKTADVFGTNQPLNVPGESNFWKQGGPLSLFMDKIPGMHSLSRLHDYFQIQFGPQDSLTRSVLNVPAMLPAAAINYGALFLTVPGSSAIVEN
ncbi:MAG: RHS repeat-associated core domain-containing protein, partial [Proteobacteria bacterium]|nr:RHS repeat-associated core domain-containing protein [Pseudomonadota bacterium]